MKTRVPVSGRYSRASIAFALSLLFVFVACEDAESPSAPTPIGSMSIEEFAAPEIQYDSARGTTTVIVQFVARNEARTPLGESDFDVQMRIDGQPIDVEGQLQQDSEALAANLHLTLVLDSSYSMLQHETPAFAPMLASAKRTLGAGSGLYVDRPGDFDWDLVWFDDLIYRPLSGSSSWSPSDVERVPSPTAGSFTKLYAALQSAITTSAQHAAEFGSGPRDQHLVVAFSDGADNYSWFDNSEVDGAGTLAGDRQYRYFGASPVGRAEIEAQLAANPEVQVHVMGLGSQVNDEDLNAVSDAGRGRYFKNPDSSKVDALFDQVIQEFTSVQTHGVTVPLPPGEYEFELIASANGATARYSFRFQGGDVEE